MADLLAVGANFLQDKMEEHASTTILYIREDVGQVSLPAVIGETQFSQDSQTGVIDRIVQRDYTVRQANLKINGIQITPQRNDIIRQTIGTKVYEARVLGEGGQPHYQESDGYGVAWRIHTKRDEL